MYSIIYYSVADDTFQKNEIYQMLSAARDSNSERGITGCLLYHEKQFLQLLEGTKHEVLGLYERILKDSRHRNIKTISEKKIGNPLFKSWSMAFHDFGNDSLSAHLKMSQIDTIFKNSAAFKNSSEISVEFFKNVNSILFNKN